MSRSLEKADLGANADIVETTDGSLVKAGQIVPCFFLKNTSLESYMRAGNMAQKEKQSSYHINLKT